MFHFLSKEEFIAICREKNLIENNAFKKPIVSTQFQNSKLENPYSWMFTKPEVIIEHTLILEFGYTNEDLKRYEIYDFELCWFLGISLRPVYTKILQCVDTLIDLLEDPQNDKKRRKYLECIELNSKYVKKGRVFYILPVSLPEFGKPLIPISDYLMAELAYISPYMKKGKIQTVTQIFLRKLIFQLELIQKLNNYPESKKLLKLKKYYKKKYNSDPNDIYEEIRMEIRLNQAYFSSFFLVYLMQMGVIEESKLPLKHYIFDEHLPDGV